MNRRRPHPRPPLSRRAENFGNVNAAVASDDAVAGAMSIPFVLTAVVLAAVAVHGAVAVDAWSSSPPIVPHATFSVDGRRRRRVEDRDLGPFVSVTSSLRGCRSRQSLPSPPRSTSTDAETAEDPAATSQGGQRAVDDMRALSKRLGRLSSCRTGSAARRVLREALPPSSTPSTAQSPLYDSTSIPRGLSSRPLSDAQLALQTRTIRSKYTVLELIEQNGDRDADRSSLAVFCVFVAGTSSAIVTQANPIPGVPEILRFALVLALCFSPLALLGYGLAMPEGLSLTLVAIQRAAFPSYRKRMVQHEAGHFLVGHLLGWPVRGYRANGAAGNAVEFYPLSDSDAGRDRAELLGFDVRRRQDDGEWENGLDDGANVSEERGDTDQPYFSGTGKGMDDLISRSVFRDPSVNPSIELSPKDNPLTSWPYGRGFDDKMVDKLSVISVAGACAEILAYGNAEGGAADLVQLRRIYGAASPKKGGNGGGKNGAGASNGLGTFSDDAGERRRRRMENRVNDGGGGNGNDGGGLDEKDMEDRTRFALGYATGILRTHLGALDALAEVMERGGTVAECVAAIETAGVAGMAVDDAARRLKFREEESRRWGGWASRIERNLLGGNKNIDDEDAGSVVEGKGGGDRITTPFDLTGDDPFYLAAALAVAFYAWAVNGGLSLH